MISSRKRGGILARIGVAVAALVGLLVVAGPATASDYSGPASDVTVDSSSYATPLWDYDEALTLRKTVDLSTPNATPFRSVTPPDYPTGPVYCTRWYQRPGCLKVPTVEFKPVGCVDSTRFELKIVATNTNRSGQLRGWAPVELEVNTNGTPFGDAALVPPATRKGPGVFEWTYLLPNGRTTIDAGYAPQPFLNFGELVIGIACDSTRP